MASTICGRPQKEKVDGVAHRRRRELQVVRAEGQACRAATEVLCRDMVERRAELDSIADEYARRKTELADKEMRAHDRLAEVLRDRSAAESALENVRNHAENVLKARRTANTVRAYRLDARWRRLHGRYRGFVADVLAAGATGATALQPLQQSTDAPRPPASKRFGRRFYTAADNLSARCRRESLRTTRSLHTLMAGYLRETASGDGDTQPVADRRGGARIPPPRRRRSSPVANKLLLDAAGPERVLDKLRVMQEQCARIAERVRRRTTRSGADAEVDGVTAEEPSSQRRQPLEHDTTDDSGGGGRTARQSDLLVAARQRLTAGRQYVAELRVLMDRVVVEMGREQLALCKLLCKTCAVCAGSRKARLNDDGGGGGNNCTVVQITGRLEHACFGLFARLDKTAAPSQQLQQQQRDHRVAHAHDVVTSCLLAVQAHRMHTVRQARDVEHRVHNFHKAVNRLLLATSPSSLVPRFGAGDDRSRRGCRRVTNRPSGYKTSHGTRQHTVASSGTQKLMPKKAQQKRTFVLTGSSTKVPIPAVATDIVSATAAIVESTTATAPATVKILCPPSIGVIEYE